MVTPRDQVSRMAIRVKWGQNDWALIQYILYPLKKKLIYFEMQNERKRERLIPRLDLFPK